MLCGEYEIPLLDVVRVARWLLHKYTHLDWSDPSLSLSKLLSAPATLHDLVDRTQGSLQNRSHLSLLHSLELTMRFDTTLPADHVFAVLGLLAPESRNSRLLRPDYTKPIAQVLRDATYAALTEYAWNTHFLCWVSHRTEDEVEGRTFPSWVPQWQRTWSEESDPSPFANLFNASTGLITRLPGHGSLDGNVLSIEGLLIDSVRETTSVLPDAPLPIESLAQFVHDGLRLCCDIGLKDISDPGVCRLARCLIAGTTAQGQLAGGEDIRAFRDWNAHVEQLDPVATERELQYHDDSNSIAVARYGARVGDVCTSRRLFNTSSGRVGLGPSMMRPGDCVVLFASTDTPFILRKDGALYHLVGECYVDGSMFGEAMQQHLDAGTGNTLFRIR